MHTLSAYVAAEEEEEVKNPSELRTDLKIYQNRSQS